MEEDNRDIQSSEAQNTEPVYGETPQADGVQVPTQDAGKPKKKSRLKFGHGLVIGAAGALLIVAVLTAGLIVALLSTGTSDRLNFKNIQAKLQIMQVLTDRYYIFEDKASDPEEGIYLGYAASLGDVYTRYITKSDYEQMQEDDSGLYCGIGAMLQQDMNTGIMTVVRPFKGSPAEEAGLQTDDILYKVDGEDITALNLDIVVSKYIRGEEGTEVEITVYRGTDLEELTFTITRRQIETPIVEYEMKADNIGYLSISEFNLITAEQYRKAIDDLTAQGMEGLIIDLRDNGGGIVDTAVEMLDYTLPDGLYTYLVDKQNGRTDFSGSDGHKVEVPIVLLVNGNTASSSEIFTGAMMDYDYATVVGTKTFGKGIVQYEIPLGDGSAFNITAAKYYTPNGVNIHGVGLEPDINVPKGENFKIMTETDNQYAAAVEELKKLK